MLQLFGFKSRRPTNTQSFISGEQPQSPNQAVHAEARYPQDQVQNPLPHRGAIGAHCVLRAIERPRRTARRLVVRRAVGAVRKLAAAAESVRGEPRQEIVEPRRGGARDVRSSRVEGCASDLM